MMKTKRKFTHQPKMKVSDQLQFSYKRAGELRRFVNQQGSIYSREITGLSQKRQKQLATAIKRARHLALLPFTQTV